jgi:hypothetical protein
MPDGRGERGDEGVRPNAGHPRHRGCPAVAGAGATTGRAAGAVPGRGDAGLAGRRRRQVQPHPSMAEPILAN